jgi:hypothetical protein
MGSTQLLSSVNPTALAAQPLPVEQMGAGEVGADASAGKPFDRLPVPALSDLAFAQQRARARLDSQRPVRATGARPLCQLA